jgi:hypothetical protein
VPARTGSDASASASKLRTRSYRWQPRDVQPSHPSDRGRLPFGRSFLALQPISRGHWQPENASVAALLLMPEVTVSGMFVVVEFVFSSDGLQSRVLVPSVVNAKASIV